MDNYPEYTNVTAGANTRCGTTEKPNTQILKWD